ncbi:MAG TPA: class I SAM-dependent methyltransferase [Kribbella sp.]|nr:class I SAM-dependent methyltransferase [Kribbella sp.]
MMITFWKVLYRLGATPWEHLGEAGAEQFDRLLAREDPPTAPYGKALDIGCGRGRHSIDLARRGWEVTGIDFVPRAIRQAKERAAGAGVDIRFVLGDVTRMAPIVGHGYRLLLDAGCFHTLDSAGQAAYAEQATAVSDPEAELLLFAFTAGTRRPMPPSITPQRVEEIFSDWKLSDSEPAALPPRMKDIEGRWFRFQRR